MKKICLLLITALFLVNTSVACATTSFDFKYARDDTSEKGHRLQKKLQMII